MASEKIVIGLTFTKAWSHPGMLAAGTSTELANVSGRTSMNPATWKVTAPRSDTPRKSHQPAHPEPDRQRQAGRAEHACLAAVEPEAQRHRHRDDDQRRPGRAEQVSGDPAGDHR